MARSTPTAGIIISFCFLFQTCMQLCLSEQSEPASEAAPPPAKKPKKNKKRKQEKDTIASGDENRSWFMRPENQQSLLNAVCELGKFEARESDLIVENLLSIYTLSCQCEHSENKLTQKFLFKKIRSIFVHEKFNVKDEESRR